MLVTVTDIRLFFKYSSKHSQLLEFTSIEENMKKDISKRISNATIELFYETLWIERHVVLE